MSIKFLFIPMIALSAACNRSANAPSSKREMFDAGGQEVITSSANEKQRTLSILYGNNAAQQAAIRCNGKHKAGEVFTLATWGQVANPHWYGTCINGRIKTVETITVLPSLHDDIEIQYKLVTGPSPKDIKGNAISRQDRISFILNQEPSVFPSR